MERGTRFGHLSLIQQLLALRQEPALDAGEVAKRDLDVAVSVEARAGGNLGTLSECASDSLEMVVAMGAYPLCVDELKYSAIQSSQQHLLVTCVGSGIHRKLIPRDYAARVK